MLDRVCSCGHLERYHADGDETVSTCFGEEGCECEMFSEDVDGTLEIQEG
jgi:hypothetical protein